MRKLFPYNEEVESLIHKAKKLFHLSMNGIASEQMSSLGYKLNYGVSLPRIYEISKEFEGTPYSRQLAEYAWWSDCRELMILATLLLDKDLSRSPFSKDDLFSWGENLFNIELCEQFSRNFLSKIHPSVDLSATYSNALITQRDSSNKFWIALGYINYANLYLQRKSVNQSIESSIFEYVVKDVYADSYLIYNSVSRYLRSKCKVDKKWVNDFIQTLDPTKGKGVAKIIEEIQIELDYQE